MKMWLSTGESLKANRKRTIERRYTAYYITAKYDCRNKVFRIVFCNRNGKEVYFNTVFYTDFAPCIRAARRVAFWEDFRFVLPKGAV